MFVIMIMHTLKNKTWPTYINVWLWLTNISYFLTCSLFANFIVSVAKVNNNILIITIGSFHVTVSTNTIIITTYHQRRLQYCWLPSITSVLIWSLAVKNCYLSPWTQALHSMTVNCISLPVFGESQYVCLHNAHICTGWLVV